MAKHNRAIFPVLGGISGSTRTIWNMRGSRAAPGRVSVGARSDGIDIHPAAVLVETDVAIDQGEDGVVATEPDVFPGMPLGAALADDDGTSKNAFSAKPLHAEALAARIAAVLDTTLTFLVSHDLERE